MTKSEIKKWFASRRKWDAWQAWTRENGDGIASRTLRRALDEDRPKPRQERAIQLAEQYIRLVTGPDPAPSYLLPGAGDVRVAQ